VHTSRQDYAWAFSLKISQLHWLPAIVERGCRQRDLQCEIANIRGILSQSAQVIKVLPRSGGGLADVAGGLARWFDLT
jgi:hypothetical protein